MVVGNARRLRDKLNCLGGAVEGWIKKNEDLDVQDYEGQAYSSIHSPRGLLGLFRGNRSNSRC